MLEELCGIVFDKTVGGRMLKASQYNERQDLQRCVLGRRVEYHGVIMFLMQRQGEVCWRQEMVLRGYIGMCVCSNTSGIFRRVVILTQRLLKSCDDNDITGDH